MFATKNTQTRDQKLSYRKTLHPQPQQVIMAEILAIAPHVVA